MPQILLEKGTLVLALLGVCKNAVAGVTTADATLRAVGKWIYTDEVPWPVDLAPRLFAPHGFAPIAETTCGHERGYLLRRR